MHRIFLTCILYGILCLHAGNTAIAGESCDIVSLNNTADELKVHGFGKESKSPYVADKLWRLLKFEEGAWHEIMDFFIKVGDPQGVMNYDILPLLLHMPKNLRRSLDNKVRDAYEGASKTANQRYLGERNLFPPKRALQLFIHQTSQAFRNFQRYKAEGSTPEQALNRYFAHIRRRVPGCEGCDYTAKSVLEVAKQVQKVAREAAASQPNAANWEFRIFGSFSNGRANPKKSDIDIMTESPGAREMLTPHLAAISRQVSQILPGSNMPVEFPGGPINRWQASPLGPVQVRITANKISIEVFPAFAANRYVFSLPGGLANGPPPLSLVVD